MKKYKVIGLMSGTSLDGLDLCFCQLWKDTDKWKYKILATKSIAYDSDFKEKLKNSIYLSAEELLIFHNSYGSWLGEQARIFIEENSLDTDLIASHGHTTHHQPQNGLTFQIGSGQHLANASGIVTVCDFRTNDVALRGQGAPLVPIGDKLLLDQYDFCLNLGGISNISFDRNDKRVAYDIGLANMILNYITDKIGLLYDKGGQLAAAGKINARMLEQLNALEYYKLPFPKSTGYEWFVSEVVPVVEHTSDSIENLLHTAVHHICEQIAIQLRSFTPVENSSLLITGGGALNHYMIATLQEKLGADIKVVVPSEILIEYKEALVFALMGVLRLEKATNVFSSVTGAPRDSCSGVVYYPS